MRYYSEEATKDLRAEFEEEVLRWPQATATRMFGCPCYQANGKLFAFLVTNGVVITQPGPSDKEALSRRFHAGPFRDGRWVVRGWLRLSVENRRDLGRIMPFVRKSYQAALGDTSDGASGAKRPASGRGRREGNSTWSKTR